MDKSHLWLGLSSWVITGWWDFLNWLLDQQALLGTWYSDLLKKSKSKSFDIKQFQHSTNHSQTNNLQNTTLQSVTNLLNLLLYVYPVSLIGNSYSVLGTRSATKFEQAPSTHLNTLVRSYNAIDIRAWKWQEKLVTYSHLWRKVSLIDGNLYKSSM